MSEAKGQPAGPVHDDVVGHAAPGVEGPEITLRPVLLTGLGIVVFAAATLVGLNVYYRHATPGPVLQRSREFPAPRLQQNPERDLAALLSEQRRRLETYGWVDRRQGIARMPIADAMRRLAERGGDAYAAPAQPERWPSLGSRGGASSALPSPGETPPAPGAGNGGGAR